MRKDAEMNESSVGMESKVQTMNPKNPDRLDYLVYNPQPEPPRSPHEDQIVPHTPGGPWSGTFGGFGTFASPFQPTPPSSRTPSPISFPGQFDDSSVSPFSVSTYIYRVSQKKKRSTFDLM